MSSCVSQYTHIHTSLPLDIIPMKKITLTIVLPYITIVLGMPSGLVEIVLILTGVCPALLQFHAYQDKTVRRCYSSVFFFLLSCKVMVGRFAGGLQTSPALPN